MIFILLSVLIGLITYKLYKSAKYWENQNVVCEPALPIVGNMLDMILRKRHMMEISLDLYRKYSTERYFGFMQFVRPMLMIRDLDLVKRVTVKDFDHFHDHTTFTENKKDMFLTRSLISLKGESWRQMRATLSPVFTSSKMRIMYQLMVDCAENFVGHFKGKGQFAVEMKDVFTRFTNDVIATTAFGIQVNSLEDPKNSFYMNGKSLDMSTLILIKVFLLAKLPLFDKFFSTTVMPEEVTNFFRTIIFDNISKREKQGIVRPDMIHLLMEARKGQLKEEAENSKSEGFATVEESEIGQSSKKLSLTDDDIVAESMLFFFAGFETVSTAACLLAHELAVNPEIQKTLQDEIDEVLDKTKKVSYETLLGMKYLDQVISELLRLWPPAVQSERVCTKRYKIEPEKPHDKEFWIEEGISIVIPTIGIHRDPRYYPNPEKFDPERFNDENKSKIVPGSYLPFGIGPRNCIGSRFALLELKTLFFYLLAKFDLVPVTGTPIPLKISPKYNNLMPEKGFRLGLKPRGTVKL